MSDFAPGLKSLADAVAARNKILAAFEQAEAEEDLSRHRDLLTFVLVGGGPTGVEMAGAIATLVRLTFRTDYRRIDPSMARVILSAAKTRLERLGVEVRVGVSADQVDADGVTAGGERIASKAVMWSAGVAPSPAGKWLNSETDRAGRVRVRPDLSVPNLPEVFVVGDTASLDHKGKPLPGVAQVAIQQGHYAGGLIDRRIAGKPAPAPFRYFDKGNMAVVGKGFAILESHKLRMSGFLAFLAWAGVHLGFLAQASNRASIFLQWIWNYILGQQGSRNIVNHHCAEQSVHCTEEPAGLPERAQAGS